MLQTKVRRALPLLALALAGCAAAASGGAPDTAAYGSDEALRLQREWWNAYTVGDTAYLRAHTAPEFLMTLSSGRTYDRAAMLAEVASRPPAGSIGVEWADEAVHAPATPMVRVATGRVHETLGQTVNVFRYLTVLEQVDGGWRVGAAQSTRVAVFTPRVSLERAGPLGDYAGEYRTPRGGVLRVVARDSALVLIEPSGAELPMEPTGPGIFEFDRLSPLNGIVRFVFSRDPAGRVVAMSRLISGEVTTFPRID
jgi:hypothetical protein